MSTLANPAAYLLEVQRQLFPENALRRMGKNPADLNRNAFPDGAKCQPPTGTTVAQELTPILRQNALR